MPRGRSAASAHSDSTDTDIDGLAETEMAKLQRQFRIMEGDRQTYTLQSQEMIRKQRVEMDKLQKEQEKLQRSLCAVELQARKQDPQQLCSLLGQCDQLDEQLESERHTQAELQQEVLSVKKKLAELRKAESSASKRHESLARQTQKATHTMENKLNRALVQYNKQLAKNSQLREELETLLVERVRFQQLHRRLEKELQDIRRETGEVISQSTAAYDARVEAQSKITMMKEKAVKDLAQYNAEITEVERVNAHKRRLKEFMTTKCNERMGLDNGEDISRRQETKGRQRTDSGDETAETLEGVLLKIQKLMGEDDLETLLSKFVQVEDSNFALFNYVNEQNTQAEVLRDQINQIKEEMERFRKDGEVREREHQAALREKEEQQREVKAQTLEYEAQAKSISKILDQIKTGVNSLFSKTDCDRAVVEDLLGTSSGIQDSNIMTYLSLVEQKTTELLTLQAYISSKDPGKDYDPKEVAQFLLGQSPELQQHAVVIQPPLAGDDYDIEEWLLTDLDDRPLTQEELRQRIMEGVLRKEGEMHSGRGREAKLTKLSTLSASHKHNV